ncbi:EAL domain-containing protein [Thalassotalea sp. LPB0316]|uniref:putative bifunctional diguanylate cyclase/phosphodiesterase n=1 Tax=Thalassotalea sp. LPB0316 TaxID=2769490 RepID=UPI001868FBB7|nr:bifunctional diguanylate cyclase/phosphodiesterase [Thalassotalea sp. LPB0316]QOL25603.1 EAL domain-containing protein [Thalassotalea sp. LPB0316]
MNTLMSAEKSLCLSNVPLAIVEGSKDAILITDEFAKVLYVNKTFTKLTGYTESDVFGKTPALLKSGLQNESFYQEMWRSLLNEGMWSGYLWNRKKDGSLFYEHQEIKVFNDINNKKLFVATFKDCSQELAIERKREFLDNYDNLTALPNKKRLSLALDKLVLQNQPFTLLKIKLNHLPKVNITFGHDCGDQVVKTIAQRITQTQHVKYFVARTGGDKFTVAIPFVNDRKKLQSVINSLTKQLEQTIKTKETDIIPFINIGHSHFPNDADTISELFDKTEKSLQKQIKQRQLPSVSNSLMDQDNYTEFALAQDIRRALITKSFEIFYQPQFDTQLKTVVAAEALIRWKHGDGFVSPALFLPVAQEYQLIKDIDLYVIEQVFIDIQSARKRGQILPKISINVSDNLISISLLKRLMEQYQITGSDFEIEVTEGVTAQHNQAFVDYLTELKQLGITTAIDDFGTGYSSLARLLNLPIDKLKIDKQFVDHIHTKEQDKKVLKAILQIANVLNKAIVVEGVEYQEQVDVLSELDTFIIQGYYFSKAVEMHEFINLVNAQQPAQCEGTFG